MQDTIAVIFDFDETLAPDSTSSFLDSIGTDVRAFWQAVVQPRLDSGWDPVPAYLYEMIQTSRLGGKQPAITREALQAWGPRVQLYPGAATIFRRLRKHAKLVSAGVQVEFYLISSGIGEILRTTKIANNFTDIWACEFHYSSMGGIEFPKNVVSFTDKTRYIFQISKGLFGSSSRNAPFDVNRKIGERDLRIPLDQMIFVGDGYTDIPCFSLLRKGGGTAIGVYDKENRDKWGRAWGFIEDGRVSNLVPADYSKGSALTNSLMMAISSIAGRIALRGKIYQG